MGLATGRESSETIEAAILTETLQPPKSRLTSPLLQAASASSFPNISAFALSQSSRS